MAVSRGADGEVEPDGAVAILGRAKRRSRASLYQELVKVLMRFVGVLDKYGCIEYQLLHARYADVDGAPR